MTYATLPAERVKAACEATLVGLGDAVEFKPKVKALRALAQATMARGGTNAVTVDLNDFMLISEAFDASTG